MGTNSSMTLRGKLARGFTLIEMAIVLVVIGLVFSGGLLAVAPVLESSKGNETLAKLDRIEQALTLYVIRYGCLPCPADPGIATGTANAGWAHGATAPLYYNGSCNTACDAALVTAGQGVVPWVTLGLSEEEAKDGFGYRIDYAVAAALVVTNGMVRTPPSTYPSGNLVVQMTVANSGTQTTTAAAYVLISHGLDHSLAWNAAGQQFPDPNAGPDQTNNSNGTPFVQDLAARNTGTVTAGGTVTYFDDIVRFRTAPIIIQLCGSNACGNPA